MQSACRLLRSSVLRAAFAPQLRVTPCRSFARGRRDPWAVLGVRPGASKEEIKKAYREKALQLHPDKPGGDASKFKELTQAMDDISKGGGTFGGGTGGFGDFERGGGAGFRHEQAINRHELDELMREMFGHGIEDLLRKQHAFHARRQQARRADWSSQEEYNSRKFVVSQMSSMQQGPGGKTRIVTERRYSDGTVETSEEIVEGGFGGFAGFGGFGPFGGSAGGRPHKMSKAEREMAEQMNREMKRELHEFGGKLMRAAGQAAMDAVKRKVTESVTGWVSGILGGPTDDEKRKGGRGQKKVR